MKKYIYIILLFACFLSNAQNGLTTATLLTPVKLLDSNEGGQTPFDVSKYTGSCDFIMFAKSDAGTSPTLALKLQHSDLVRGDSSYRISNTDSVVDVELRESAALNVEIALKFQADVSKQIKSVWLNLKKNGTVSTTDLYLKIIGFDGADPDESDIVTGADSVALSTADIATTYTGYEFAFTAPVELIEDSTYFIVLSSDYTESASNNIAWKAEQGLTTGGNHYSYNGTAWTAGVDTSQVATIYEYAFSDVSGGAYTSVTTTGSAQVLRLNADNMKKYIRVHSTVGGTNTPAFYSGVVINGFKE